MITKNIFVVIVLLLSVRLQAQIKLFGFRYSFQKNNNIINAIYPESPAAKAGIEVGDLIESINNKTVLNQDNIASILTTDKITLGILHKEKHLSFQLQKAEVFYDTIFEKSFKDFAAQARKGFKSLIKEKINNNANPFSDLSGYEMFTSTKQLSNSGKNLTFILRDIYGDKDSSKVALCSVFYQGNNLANATKTYQQYINQLKFFLADEANYYEDKQNSDRVLYIAPKDTKGLFESSRYQISFRQNGNNYEVLCSITGGKKEICKPIQPDSTLVSITTRNYIQYFYTVFYNNKVEKELKGDEIQAPSAKDGELKTYFKTKYIFPEATRCNIYQYKNWVFGDDYHLDIEWPSQKDKLSADNFYNQLTSIVYNSLTKEFVCYEKKDEKFPDKKIFAFAVNLQNVMFLDKHILEIKMDFNKEKNEYVFTGNLY